MEKERKRTTIIILSAIAAVCFLAAIAIIFLPKKLPSASGIRPDRLSRIKYVTDSGLEDRESVMVVDKYYVIRVGSHLEIYSREYEESSDPKDWVTYEVFDSAADAKRSFDSEYEFIIDFWNSNGVSGSEKILDKGACWFIADIPVFDAVIHKFFYLADNVIISAEVSVTAYMTTEDTTEREETTAPKVSRNSLSSYIKDNAADLRRFVLTEICPKIEPEKPSEQRPQ